VFVTLEGGEGAGKSTQIDGVRRLLEREGWSVVTCREPGGTALGERLREALFATTDDEPPPSPESELLIFNAARAQLVQQVIRPALDSGAAVICDRFTGSTVAYQHHGRGLPREVVDAVIDRFRWVRITRSSKQTRAWRLTGQRRGASV